MRKLYTTLLLAAFCTVSVIAQNVEFKSANFKDDKEGYKRAEESLKKGDEHLTLGNDAVALVNDPGLNFKQAVRFYLKSQEFNPNSAELNMKIGNCYLYTTDKTKAFPYIKKAYEYWQEYKIKYNTSLV